VVRHRILYVLLYYLQDFLQLIKLTRPSVRHYRYSLVSTFACQRELGTVCHAIAIGGTTRRESPCGNPWMFGGFLTTRGQPLEGDLDYQGAETGQGIIADGTRNRSSSWLFRGQRRLLNNPRAHSLHIVTFLPPPSKGNAGRSDLEGSGLLR
jgi:hypothetical protein